ncbi:unnamed protein product [Mycena citricolor]|uniref:DUF6535 domain-containing protein n=1 Tax=Mycena citricolor TaxID=2018698 RepID=A0AAD2GUA6_9AGAR|nr:unnamed protein product [Mycena citricolor]
MSQADRQQADKREDNEAYSERERASGNKLWGVYISEAQSYDQGLIDGWRSEMDGLLIFAGLFSGVVTTFIIESYKTLNPDSGSQTVVLLSQTVVLLNQISHQLGNSNNGTAVMDALPPPAVFSPPASSLICNALWFTSLALSLSSALVATLVEQWAREYQHRTTMFSSPSIRSRVYMYLYYGLRRFNMHAVVGVPPLLLHAALLLFFAGLVAFLVPINIIIMGISSALLLLFVSVYGTFTALPLFFFDSPYQTPLSRILWSLKQNLGHRLQAHVRRTAAKDPESHTDLSVPVDTCMQAQSMVEAMTSVALQSTVDPFVEGLTQALWDFEKNEGRAAYRAHFERLLRDPQVRLCQRLGDFMAGSNSDLLEHPVRLRRQLSVLRALWAVCAFSIAFGSPLECPIGETDVNSALLGPKFLGSAEVQMLVPGVAALIRLNIIEFWAAQPNGEATQQALARLAIKTIRTGDGRSITTALFLTSGRSTFEEEKRWAYAQYLINLSESPASFQRELTHSLFHRSPVPFLAGDHDPVMVEALELLIGTESEEKTDNHVFAARHMICAIAQTSTYPPPSAHGTEYMLPTGLAPFLVRHPSLAIFMPGSVWQPDLEEKYTRYLCNCMLFNLVHQLDLQASVDSLKLIYYHLDDIHSKHLEDLDAHLLTLHTLRSSSARTACIHVHHVVALVQSVAVCCISWDLSEATRGLGVFDDEDWFRAVIRLDDKKWMERRLTREDDTVPIFIRSCALFGVISTFSSSALRIQTKWNSTSTSKRSR